MKPRPHAAGKVGGPTVQPIYLTRMGYRLGELPFFSLTNFVRPNTGKTKILHISPDRIQNKKSLLKKKFKM